MRSLVVARWAPWPPASGARLRSANVVAALADVSDVDLFLLAKSRDGVGSNAPEGLLRRTGEVGRSERPVRRVDRVLSALPRTQPAAIRRLDHAGVRAAFREWCVEQYDLAWFVRIESWLALGDLVSAPAIVDYDDLRDHFLRSRLQVQWTDPPSQSRPGALREQLKRWSVDVEARRWRRLQHQVASHASAVVVCSELDRTRLGAANAFVVRNGADLPEQPVGRVEVARPPTICMYGSLGYAPNADAAVILVRDVAPLVWAQRPDAVIRLVGEFDDRVGRLADPPMVTVTGRVPDIVTELARVDIVAVPLRQGAGTRIKVLEALAHRIPVVATSIAVEGLEVEHGRHVLIADTPEDFAAGCLALLNDRELRVRLADGGARLVRDEYGWNHARAAVRELATATAGDSTPPPVPRGEADR